MFKSVIIGSGHYLPKKVVKNSDFLKTAFYTDEGELIETENELIIDKFKSITEIEERRYVKDDSLNNSDIGAAAGKIALEDAGIDKESLDYIIVAHNFGDVSEGDKETDILPSISTRIKGKLGVMKTTCKPYDMIFGCPGWIEGMILADNLIASGIAKNILVIGTETLSRIVDPHSRDCMIFADGAGAVVLQGKDSNEKGGIIGHGSRSDVHEESSFLINAPSVKKDYEGSKLNIHMKGRKIYEYALKNVPKAMKQVLDDNNTHLSEIKKVLIHQANAKMDHAILKRLYKLFKLELDFDEVTPMTIKKYGNSSVATVPTLYDKLVRKDLENHTVKSGDLILFASVGAGMHINAMLYKMP